MQTLYFGRLLKAHQQPGDASIVLQLLQELQYLEVNDIGAEHISYLMKAFSEISAAVQDAKFSGDPKMTKKITKFLPRLLKHYESELYRCKITDVIALLEGYKDLWEAGILEDVHYTKVHEQCAIYLDNYMDKSKRNMNGNNFSDLMRLIGDAKFNGIYTYDQKIIIKLEKDFVGFRSENSFFTVSDLKNLLVAFDRASNLNNMPRLLQTIIDILPQATKNSDADLLEMLKIFDRMQLFQLEKYEHLCHFLQDYVWNRFNFIDKELTLDYALFINKIGLWYWDQNLMGQIEEYF